MKFQGDELGFLFAGVRKGVSVATRQPFHVAGLEVPGHGPLTFDVAAYIKFGDGYHQVRAGVVMARQSRAWLQVDLGYAHTILHEHDVLRATGKNVEAALFVPFCGRSFVGGFVLQKLDSDISEWGVSE